MGILNREELMINGLLNEGKQRLVPLAFSFSPSYDVSARVSYIIGFVGWMLKDGRYNGPLKKYFSGKLEVLEELGSLVQDY